MDVGESGEDFKFIHADSWIPVDQYHRLQMRIFTYAGKFYQYFQHKTDGGNNYHEYWEAEYKDVKEVKRKFKFNTVWIPVDKS